MEFECPLHVGFARKLNLRHVEIDRDRHNNDHRCRTYSFIVTLQLLQFIFYMNNKRDLISKTSSLVLLLLLLDVAMAVVRIVVILTAASTCDGEVVLRE